MREEQYMKILATLSFTLVCCSLLTSCDPYRQNEQIGTATGAIAGGLLGSTIGGGSGKAIATGVGVVGGALIGNSIGRSMDQQNSYNYYRNGYYGPQYYPDPRYDGGYYNRNYYGYYDDDY
jgi:hypothetical protein